MKSTLIALAVGSVLASTGAAAGTTVARIDRDTGFVPVQYSTRVNDERAMSTNEREAQLQARIERGINDGRITHSEARGLYRELDNIAAREHRFMANGRLDSREESELRRDLDRLSDNIRAQLRDEDRRYSYDEYGRPYVR